MGSREARTVNRFANKIMNPTATWWECWLMPPPPSGRHYRDGYARFGDRTMFDELYAHRIVASRVYGPIPEGHEVDHRCFTRNCVNPFHLAVVPASQNRRFRWQVEGKPNPALNSPERHRRLREIRESPTCKRGHLWSETTKVNSQGKRVCVECSRISGRKHDAKRRKKS